MNVLSLFDGISCGQLALNRCGIKYDNYFASEIDSNAIKITQTHFPQTIQIGDIRNVRAKDLPKIDLLLAGSPCQGFSLAGKKLALKDPRSSLFFEFFRLLKETSPKYWLLENTTMKPESRKVISTLLEEDPIQINSALVSAQNRKRLYWSNFHFSIPKDKRIMLSDLIGEYDGIYVRPRGNNKGGIRNYAGKSPTITTSSWEHNFFIIKDGIKEPFHPVIAEKLQNLPTDYTSAVAKTNRFKLIGNGFTVEVISHILSHLKGKL